LLPSSNEQCSAGVTSSREISASDTPQAASQPTSHPSGLALRDSSPDSDVDDSFEIGRNYFVAAPISRMVAAPLAIRSQLFSSAALNSISSECRSEITRLRPFTTPKETLSSQLDSKTALRMLHRTVRIQLLFMSHTTVGSCHPFADSRS
jgi:hypothetical protein